MVHFVTPHPYPPGGGALGDTISASSFEKYIGNAIIPSDYTGNIPGEARSSEGGSRKVGKEGRREGGEEEGTDGRREGGREPERSRVTS